jgi:hypothetical protein
MCMRRVLWFYNLHFQGFEECPCQTDRVDRVLWFSHETCHLCQIEYSWLSVICEVSCAEFIELYWHGIHLVEFGEYLISWHHYETVQGFFPVMFKKITDWGMMSWLLNS